MFDGNTYEEDIKIFKKILSKQADELLSTEEVAVIYIGRGTCPYCRKFAKKLSAVSHKINTVTYYIDSEDFSDDGIASFRQKYNIPTVPGFIVTKHGEIDVRCDSSIPEDEILNMIK